MSWWDTGQGEDMMGDGPADILSQGLGDLAAWREQTAGERPTLPGLLAGLGAALSEQGCPVIVTAETASGHVGGADDTARAEGATYLPRLRVVLAELAGAYQERWERGPRPSEVVYAAGFVLGPFPGRYLRERDADGLELNALHAFVSEPI
ncbi:MAG: hypothetical protein K0Q72_1325 [Armatimonadetes bacterium]|jgi:hypothetical protein|nr:hypothetical protein [Armatimonadota bacterium]